MTDARSISDLVERCLLLGFEEPEPPKWVLEAAPRVGAIALYGGSLRADGDAARLATALREPDGGVDCPGRGGW